MLLFNYKKIICVNTFNLVDKSRILRFVVDCFCKLKSSVSSRKGLFKNLKCSSSRLKTTAEYQNFTKNLFLYEIVKATWILFFL